MSTILEFNSPITGTKASKKSDSNVADFVLPPKAQAKNKNKAGKKQTKQQNQVITKVDSKKIFFNPKDPMMHPAVHTSNTKQELFWLISDAHHAMLQASLKYNEVFGGFENLNNFEIAGLGMLADHLVKIESALEWIEDGIVKEGGDITYIPFQVVPKYDYE